MSGTPGSTRTSTSSATAPLIPPAKLGVRIAGTGSALGSQDLTNADLVKMMDTSDEWIVQRTGIHSRKRIDRSKGESTKTLAAEALRRALADAKMDATELDLIIIATMTADMLCPPTACLVANLVGAGHNTAAFDLNGACSGFVYGLNLAHDLIRAGTHKAIAIIGADTISTLMDYSTAGRGTAIIFGDGAGAAIVRATDDARRGVLAQGNHSAGEGWKEIFVPAHETDFPAGVACEASKLGRVQMNGSNVFKFAVGTFPLLIEETLAKANVTAADIDMYLCHQSNQRILHAARDRFGLPDHKLYINIDRVGNTVAASVPLCLDEARRAGKIPEGGLVMFLAFGAGLTWASSLWRV
jgi:3-oxoacyl-[acyl-carrier-protein] synthase-3